MKKLLKLRHVSIFYSRGSTVTLHKHLFSFLQFPKANIISFSLSLSFISTLTTQLFKSSTTVATTMPPGNHLITSVLLLILLSFHPPATVTAAVTASDTPKFREAPAFRNGKNCSSTIHIAMTLDYSSPYLRGSIAGVLSVLQHATCPENTFFHFLAVHRHFNNLNKTITSTFPYLNFKLYNFNPTLVRHLISSSVRRALDQPLNYARIYLADLLPTTVNRIIYLDSDLIVVDDIAKLWNIDLNGRVLGAPEYCHANFTHYFTNKFWFHPTFSNTFENRTPCYFNTGVMVIDLQKWRNNGYTRKLEHWMRVQKRYLFSMKYYCVLICIIMS